MRLDLPFLPATVLDSLPWTGEPLPAGVIDLAQAEVPAQARAGSAAPRLPPFPVIGLGEARHPLAPCLDLVVPDADEAAEIVDNCRRHPQAAAVLVQVLRLIATLPPAAGLVAESLAYGVLQAGAEHLRWRASRRPETLAPAPPGAVRIDREGDRLAVLMDRPAAFNAIDRAMRDGLREAFDIAALDPDIRCLTLGGTGRAFSVGADLAEFGTTIDPALAHAIRQQTLPAHALVACAGRFEARVHGACIGSGLEMAAFAQTLVAAPTAWFQLPELAMGLIPGAGGCVSLTRRIGRGATARLVLGGRRIGVRTALAWGLVDRIAEDGLQPSPSG